MIQLASLPRKDSSLLPADVASRPAVTAADNSGLGVGMFVKYLTRYEVVRVHVKGRQMGLESGLACISDGVMEQSAASKEGKSARLRGHSLGRAHACKIWGSRFTVANLLDGVYIMLLCSDPPFPTPWQVPLWPKIALIQTVEIKCKLPPLKRRRRLSWT